jgi:TolA-binding protein|tara:strand:+ start:649 stop:876 length:228 start_codon:yes stop_codon:yes gene_type:complete
MKIEKHERTAKVEIKKEQEEESSVVQELSDKINYLNDVIAQSEKQMAEKDKQMSLVTESNDEWEAKTRLLFVEIQ